MQHKKTAPTGVYQQSNKADFAVENKEEVSAPSGIGSALSESLKPAKQKAKKVKEEAVEAEAVVEVVAEEAPAVEAVAVEAVSEEAAPAEEESTDSE
jgi:hypothetical protein